MDQLEATDKTKGFNIVPYSDRREMSSETKSKISSAMKGKPKTSEARANMCKAQRNRSPEWNKRISDGQRGLKKSDSAKQNMSEARKRLFASGYVSPQKGRQHTPETKEKLSKANKGQIPPNKGKSMSEEQKRKVSAGLNLFHNKTYCCLETGEKFNSLVEIARSINVTSPAISAAIHRHRPCQGLTFIVEE